MANTRPRSLLLRLTDMACSGCLITSGRISGCARRFARAMASGCAIRTPMPCQANKTPSRQAAYAGLYSGSKTVTLTSCRSCPPRRSQYGA
jgi:hypothetical protein